MRGGKSVSGTLDALGTGAVGLTSAFLEDLLDRVTSDSPITTGDNGLEQEVHEKERRHQRL